MGYRQAGYNCLKYLIDKKENIVAVVTNDDTKEKSRWCQSVMELALKNNLLVLTPKKNKRY